MAENSTHDPLQSQTSGKKVAPQKLIPVDPKSRELETTTSPRPISKHLSAVTLKGRHHAGQIT